MECACVITTLTRFAEQELRLWYFPSQCYAGGLRNGVLGVSRGCVACGPGFFTVLCLCLGMVKFALLVCLVTLMVLLIILCSEIDPFTYLGFSAVYIAFTIVPLLWMVYLNATGVYAL